MRAYFTLFFFGTGSVLAQSGYSHHANPVCTTHDARQHMALPPARESVAATWFASWHAQDFPLSNISWSKYTRVIYGFAETTANISVLNITNPEVFKDFVSIAHANNCSAAISVGGWDGSLYFSTAVATAENRTAFVKTLTNLVQDNNLDGLDFDWESPGLPGVGCNTRSPNDTSNYLAFLKELRIALPKASISAAAAIRTFVSPDQSTPSTNVSEFASVFDYIALMNYAAWGPWSTSVGPKAPLNDTCVANATNRLGSAVSAVKAWASAGIPVDQLVLGVPTVGQGYSVSPSDAFTANGTLGVYVPFNKTFTPRGDAWDEVLAPGTLDVCGKPEVLVSGSWDFWGLVAEGFLNENGAANTATGIAYRYDKCSQTPYVYNKTSGVMVSYDNARSFAAKGSFIQTFGLRGFSIWEAGGDFNDILLDSIRSSAGFPEVNPNEEECGGTTIIVPTTTISVSATDTSSVSTLTSTADPAEGYKED